MLSSSYSIVVGTGGVCMLGAGRILLVDWEGSIWIRKWPHVVARRQIVGGGMPSSGSFYYSEQ